MVAAPWRRRLIGGPGRWTQGRWGPYRAPAGSGCVAATGAGGLASDSRTHDGVAQINTDSKMHRFEVTGERLCALLCAGNLSTGQTVAQGMRDLPRFPWEGPARFDSP